MSGSPASWSGGVLAEIRTRYWAADPKTVATDPGDFGSVAIWRDSGLYLGRAPIHGRVVGGGGRVLPPRGQGGRRYGMGSMVGANVAGRNYGRYSKRGHGVHRGSLLSA